jgi:hypothetical protein
MLNSEIIKKQKQLLKEINTIFNHKKNNKTKHLISSQFPA